MLFLSKLTNKNIPALICSSYIRHTSIEKHIQSVCAACRHPVVDGTTEIDLTNPAGTETGSGITTEELFGYTMVNNFGKLINSGNVPLDVYEYSGLGLPTVRTIQPTDSEIVQNTATYAIDTKGTVTIGNRLHIASDGRCYFFFIP